MWRRIPEPPGATAYGVGMRATLTVLLVIIAVLAIAAGVMYAVVPVHSLPSFIPGHAKVGNNKHTHRGIAGIALGVVLLVIAVVVGSSGRRRRW